MSLFAIALIVEIIFFGPLGLTIYDVSVRKTLITILVACSVVPMLSQRPISTWQITFLLGTILFLVVWGAVVPLVNGVDFKMSVAEVQPLTGLLLVLPFYHLVRHDGAELYLKTVRICAMMMAIIVILVGAASNVFSSPAVGLAFRDFYTGLNDNESGIYIGPMTDGTFRVMLVNFIIFPLMLCYYNWKEFNLPWSVFYTLAILATGTRAFLLVVALIVGVSLLRKRPLLGLLAVAGVSVLAVVYLGDLQRLHAFDFSSDLESSSSRFTQFFSLMILFWQHPIMGAGLGSNAIIIRSIESPYSYELTYVALLAKLGFVGSAILVTAVSTWAIKLMRGSQNWPSIATLILSIILMTATNPYLINSVGMTIVAFLIVIGAQADSVKARAGNRVEPSRYPRLASA